MDKPIISVLGCGWLGLPLAQKLRETEFIVWGSTTRIECFDAIINKDIKPYRVVLNPFINDDFDASFLKSDILIVNIPPHRRPDIQTYHRMQFEELKRLLVISSIQKIIMVSSTSVYPSLSKIMTEVDAVNPDKESGKALLIAEQILSSIAGIETTIVRFGGLIGYDRNPGRFLQQNILHKNGTVPVNLIHRDDCINIITEIILQEKWGKVYNACCDIHPTRNSFYSKAAEIVGFDLPLWAESSGDERYKIIDSSKMKRELGYVFQYSNPIDCLNN